MTTFTVSRFLLPVREQQPPVREDYKNAAQFCKADAEFLGEICHVPFADADDTEAGAVEAGCDTLAAASAIFGTGAGEPRAEVIRRIRGDSSPF